MHARLLTPLGKHPSPLKSGTTPPRHSATLPAITHGCGITIFLPITWVTFAILQVSLQEKQTGATTPLPILPSTSGCTTVLTVPTSVRGLSYPAEYYNWADAQGFLGDYPFSELPNYFSLKIRCREGNWTSYSVGGAVDWPIMRVEEMYLIEAEALGMSQGEAAGIAALESFMQTYRDPSYSYAAAAATFSEGFVKNFQEEVLFQKRVEFFEEGVGFFDAKRIRPGMKTWYPGSNVIHDTMKYDVEEVSPYWNFVIPVNEEENNEYIIAEDAVPTEIDGVMTTRNNPDPTKKIENVVS